MDWTGWIGDVLAAGNWPDTAANQKFLSEWHAHEESACHANPLNTTLHWPGSVDCVQTGTPGVAVQAYLTPADGARATVRTLGAPAYVNLVRALGSGDPYTYPSPVAVEDELRTWGSTSFADLFHVEVFGGLSSPPGTTPGSPGAQAAAKFPNQVGPAWMRLMRTLAITAPRSLHLQAQARARLNRAVR